MILRWLHDVMRRRRGEEKTDKDKMRDRLEIITRESRLLKVVSDVKSEECKECEVSKIKDEISSVKAVLEMKMEEVQRLRKELERRRWWREEKVTQTEVYNEEHGSSKDKTCR